MVIGKGTNDLVILTLTEQATCYDLLLILV